MSTRNILIFPDSRLRETAAEITEFDDSLETLIRDMQDTMYAAHGIGLAGPQIGVLKRILVLDTDDHEQTPKHYVNPQIIARNGKVKSKEGCLSIPDFRDTVERAETITIEAMNSKGERFEENAEGLHAICLQHEIDHLNGVLFIDHLSSFKKQLFKRWAKKHLKLLESGI